MPTLQISEALNLSDESQCNGIKVISNFFYEDDGCTSVILENDEQFEFPLQLVKINRDGYATVTDTKSKQHSVRFRALMPLQV